MDELFISSVSLIKMEPKLASELNSDSVNSEQSTGTDKLIQVMGHDPITIDALIRLTTLTAENFSAMLMILELEGKVATAIGGSTNVLFRLNIRALIILIVDIIDNRADSC